MYERFTDRARKVMQHAQAEAERFNWECVDTAQVLLGLILEGHGVGGAALKNLGLSVLAVRQVLADIRLNDEHAVIGRRPLTPRVRQLHECAIEQAKALNHNYVGTEHLALGLARSIENGETLVEGQQVPIAAAAVLNHFKITPAMIREEVMTLLGKQATPPAYHGDTEFIVAEVSKNLPDPAAAPDILAKRFELVIEHNRGRGYELHSWQLNRVYTPGPHQGPFKPEINETIIAVFRRTTPAAGGTVPDPLGSATSRARTYLATVPPVNPGQSAYDRTSRVAQYLLKNFGLTPEEALPLLADWGRTIEPPWPEEELRRFVGAKATQEGPDAPPQAG